MKLFYRTLGQGRPLIILHGLFGTSDNWNTLAKVFSREFTVFVVDQRNHGQSPQSELHNYQLLTEDLHAFIDEHAISHPIILGHSMGGKVAMNFAVKNPNKLSALIVVDIAPKHYPIHHDHILRGLLAIPLDKIQSRNQADEILSRHIPEISTRQFLLKNLARDENQQFIWKINLSTLSQHVDRIGDGMQYPGKYHGPTLFIRGIKSSYITSDDERNIKIIFPSAALVSLQAGHWVHAEQPDKLCEAILGFLK